MPRRGFLLMSAAAAAAAQNPDEVANWKEYVETRIASDKGAFKAMDRSFDADKHHRLRQNLVAALECYKDRIGNLPGVAIEQVPGHPLTHIQDIACYMLLMSHVHIHIQNGHTLTELPKPVQEFLTSYAQAIPAPPIKPNTTLSPAVNQGFNFHIDLSPSASGLFLFVNGGRVVALGTHDNFKPKNAARGETTMLYNSAGIIGSRAVASDEYLINFARGKVNPQTVGVGRR